MSIEAMKLALEQAYLDGFNDSAEGYNGEYPFRDDGLSPTKDRHWVERRNSALRQAIEQAEKQDPMAERDAFERHWKKVRGDKKSDRELKRHPLQPQTYVQDSANRHWVTWQAATRKAAPLPRQPEKAEKQEPRQEAQIVNWNCPCGNTVTFRGFTQAPPPRQPLTDEQKDAARWRFLVDNSYDKEGLAQFHVWHHTWEPHSQTSEPTEWKARVRGPAFERVIDEAIEAAHGIKENA